MNGSHDRARRPARPAHPPFTAFPIAAYVFAAAFDTASVIGGSGHSWAGQLWHAGTFVLIAGLVTCLPAMGTGFRDLIRFAARWPGDTGPSTTSARSTPTVAAHVVVMAGTFMIGSGDLAWRLSEPGTRAASPLGAAALSLAAAAVACTGGFLGGRLVFRHGIGVTGGAALVLGGGANGPGAESELPEPAAGDDHVRGAQDARDPGAAPAGPASVAGARRRPPR
jgi:uncharacterized membrane protein